MAKSQKREIPWLWVGFAVLLIALTAAWFVLPVSDWLKSFNQWVASLGALGYVIFAAVYVVGTVVLAPGSPLSIAAGLVFSSWGLPLVIVAATIGAGLAFLVARYIARERVARMTEHRPKFKAVDRAVTEEGWKVVLLLRLNPVVPFNLQNYFFGLTDIKFWHYLTATFVGIIPGAALYVYLGAIGAAAGTGDSGSVLKWVFFGVGLLATVVVTVLIARKAKAKLDALGVEEERSEGAPGRAKG
jgi:uncharacterized membrane protein YdjX (TVP38/TMEM64 family)